MKHTTEIQRSILCLGNAPTLGTILGHNLLLIPTRCPTWGLTLTGAIFKFEMWPPLHGDELHCKSGTF